MEYVGEAVCEGVVNVLIEAKSTATSMTVKSVGKRYM